MNPFFRLFNIHNTINQLDKDISELGWHKANKKFIDKLNIGIKTSISKLPKQKGILIYANHPTGLDPYLISSVIKRNDIYFFSDVYQTMKGKSIASHALPIYYWNKLDFLKRPLFSLPGYFIMRINTGYRPRDKAKKMNNKSIQSALMRLKKGNIVLIFPSGGDKPTLPWKSGIGKLLLLCRKEKIKVSLLEIRVENLDEQHLLWHFISGKKYFKFNPILIKNRLINISNLNIRKNAFELSQELKRIYYK